MFPYLYNHVKGCFNTISMENIFIWTIKKPLNFMLYLFYIWLSQLTWPITFCNLTHIITGIFSNMQWEGGRGVCCCYETKTPIVWCILTTDFISPPFHELIIVIILLLSLLIFHVYYFHYLTLLLSGDDVSLCIHLLVDL